MLSPARQRLVQEGVRPQFRLWGFIPRAPVTLSEEERFRELDLLVRDYDAIIAGVRDGKEAYEVFCAQLATGVQQAVMRKSGEIRQLEVGAYCPAPVGSGPAGPGAGAVEYAE